MVQGVRPEFKTQYHKKTQKTSIHWVFKYIFTSFPMYTYVVNHRDAM
jgi:hypothetical protein